MVRFISPLGLAPRCVRAGTPLLRSLLLYVPSLGKNPSLRQPGRTSLSSTRPSIFPFLSLFLFLLLPFLTSGCSPANVSSKVSTTSPTSPNYAVPAALCVTSPGSDIRPRPQPRITRPQPRPSIASQRLEYFINNLLTV